MDRYLKAITAAITSGYFAAQLALLDNHVTPREVTYIVMAAVLSGAATWGVPNATPVPPPPEDQPPSV